MGVQPLACFDGPAATLWTTSKHGRLLTAVLQAAQWYDVQQLPKLAFDRE